MAIRAIAGVGVVLSLAVTSFSLFLGVREHVYASRPVHPRITMVAGHTGVPQGTSGIPLARDPVCFGPGGGITGCN